MTPLQFLSFRDRLDSASGFQSAGFRQVEAMLGVATRAAVNGAASRTRRPRVAVAAAQAAPSVWASFLDYLTDRGHEIPDDVVARDPAAATEPDERVQEVLVGVYRGDPDAAWSRSGWSTSTRASRSGATAT